MVDVTCFLPPTNRHRTTGTSNPSAAGATKKGNTSTHRAVIEDKEEPKGSNLCLINSSPRARVFIPERPCRTVQTHCAAPGRLTRCGFAVRRAQIAASGSSWHLLAFVREIADGHVEGTRCRTGPASRVGRCSIRTSMRGSSSRVRLSLRRCRVGGRSVLGPTRARLNAVSLGGVFAGSHGVDGHSTVRVWLDRVGT